MQQRGQERDPPTPLGQNLKNGSTYPASYHDRCRRGGERLHQFVANLIRSGAWRLDVDYATRLIAAGAPVDLYLFAGADHAWDLSARPSSSVAPSATVGMASYPAPSRARTVVRHLSSGPRWRPSPRAATPTDGATIARRARRRPGSALKSATHPQYSAAGAQAVQRGIEDRCPEGRVAWNVGDGGHEREDLVQGEVGAQLAGRASGAG